jgi:hypothetical protein
VKSWDAATRTATMLDASDNAIWVAPFYYPNGTLAPFPEAGDGYSYTNTGWGYEAINAQALGALAVFINLIGKQADWNYSSAPAAGGCGKAFLEFYSKMIVNGGNPDPARFPSHFPWTNTNRTFGQVGGVTRDDVIRSAFGAPGFGWVEHWWDLTTLASYAGP